MPWLPPDAGVPEAGALEGGPVESLLDLASAHPSGLRVAALTSSPLNTEILEPTRVAEAISAANAPPLSDALRVRVEELLP